MSQVPSLVLFMKIPLVRTKTLLRKNTPNALTLTALCCGLTSIKCSFEGSVETAAFLIILACYLDFFDGHVARLLGSHSVFGGHFDSLADVVNFGVAPCVFLYCSAAATFGWAGWTVCMMYALCIAGRLARFNARTSFDPHVPTVVLKHLTGLPAPSAAGFVLIPAMWGFVFHCQMSSALQTFWAVVCGLLAISTLPTLSIKGKKWGQPKRWFPPVFFLQLGLTYQGQPWVLQACLGTLYLFLVPTMILRKKRARMDPNADADGPHASFPHLHVLS